MNAWPPKMFFPSRKLKPRKAHYDDDNDDDDDPEQYT
jgi:hypothetical protein